MAETTKRARLRDFTEEEQHILIEAMRYCLHHFSTLWTSGGIREERGADSSRRWIIPVYLRYPTGHEGNLGELSFDGKQFTELTDRQLMEERARQIEADPALQREWNAARATSVRTRKS